MAHLRALVREHYHLIAYLMFTGAFIISLFLVDQETDARIDDVNRSRAEITYTACLATNERHDRTIDQLDALIAKRKDQFRAQIREADPAEQKLLRAQLDALDASRASTVSLIEALAPFQNCNQIVLDRFGFVPNVR